jgi:outer membrane protein insertion porin family
MYKLENVNVYDVAPSSSVYIKEQRGSSTTSAISLAPSIDTRDDYYNPRRGNKSGILIQSAGGILGGDNDFVKIVGQTSWFFPLPLKTTLNLRAQAGAIFPYGGKAVPVYEKFYVGGASTVRGYEYGMAGPTDYYGTPIGANYMVVFNTELIFPLSREIGLRGALFFDIGKGWGTDSVKPGYCVTDPKLCVVRNRGIAIGAGPGIRWFSPFGPINIDIGFNLNPQRGEKGYVIDFNAGSTF